MSANQNDSPGGRMRIGDREREDAIRRLGEHYEAGRLTSEEHTERVDAALAARTEKDLGALFTDLPGEAGTTAPVGGPLWMHGRRGVPLPLLGALLLIGGLVSTACVIGAGHPPVLPLLLLVGAVLVVRRQRHDGWSQERGTQERGA